MLKIWRSSYSRFGISVEHPDDLQDETVLANQNYTDQELKRIADSGFNAIWVHGQLHHLVTNPRFPEFAPHSAIHLKAMRALCQRAAKYGIRVLLYMQPPRGIPVSNLEFWSHHPEVGGQEYTRPGFDGKFFTLRCLCTSSDTVKDYLKEAMAELCNQLPELEGFIFITASEYPQHCYSAKNCRPGHQKPGRQAPCECPRCGLKEPEDVVTELIQTLRDGVRSVSITKTLIFWNWSWTMYLDAPCEAILQRLPQDIFLLADFERGGFRQDGTYINEYSLGYSGPSEQYQDLAKIADSRGIPVMPKLQLGTTHELASVRSLPIYPSLFRKADYIRKNHCPGFMGCWNFGNLQSDSIVAFNFFLGLTQDLTEQQALRLFAQERYPKGNPDAIVNAWELFAKAMENYPFSIPFLYYSPLNHALALLPKTGPLDGQKVGRSWLPDSPRGDSYEDSITQVFPLESIITHLQRLSQQWNQGLKILSQELDTSSQEYGNAAICGAAWESAINMYKLYQLKKDWNQQALPTYRNILQDELVTVQKALPYVENDPEQGWHIEGNFHCFDAEMIKRKIHDIKAFLNTP